MATRRLGFSVANRSYWFGLLFECIHTALFDLYVT